MSRSCWIRTETREVCRVKLVRCSSTMTTINFRLARRSYLIDDVRANQGVTFLVVLISHGSNLSSTANVMQYLHRAANGSVDGAAHRVSDRVTNGFRCLYESLSYTSSSPTRRAMDCSPVTSSIVCDRMPGTNGVLPIHQVTKFLISTLH